MSIPIIIEKNRAILFGTGLGFFATLAQIVLVREFLMVRGTSELSLGILLGCWLLCVGLGAFVGKKIKPSPQVLMNAVILFSVFTPAAILWVRFYEFWFRLPLGGDVGTLKMVGMSVLATLPTAGAVGFFFTAAAALLTTYKLVSIGKLYISEGVGAALAGLLFSFVFSLLLGPLAIIGLALALLGGAALSFFPRPYSKVWWAVPIGGLLFFGVMVVFDIDGHSIEAAFHLQPDRGKLQHCKDTPYNRVCVGLNQGQYQVYRGGHLAYVFPDKYDRPGPVHVALSQHIQPQKVLLLGGGIPNRIDTAVCHGAGQVYYLDVDPHAQEVAAPFMSAATNGVRHQGNVHLQSGSGRSFLNTHKNEFDVIIDFSPPPLTAAQNSFFTLEFYEYVRAALTANGVYVHVTKGSANVFSPPAAQLLANEQATLQKVFSTVFLLLGVQSYWVASNGSHATEDKKIVERRLISQCPAAAHYFSASDVFNSQRNRRAMEALTPYDGSINRDERPDAFVHSLALRQLAGDGALPSKWKGDGQSRTLGLVLSLGGSIVVILLSFFLSRKQSCRSSAGLLSIATTGLCAMGVEMLLLYLFSAQWGGLYSHIAWLLAGFMVGAAGGAAWGVAISAEPGNKAAGLHHAGLLCDGLMLLLVLGCVGIFSVEILPFWVFGALMVITGAVTGVAFPVFLAITGKSDEDAAPWRMEGAEHAGAALGAVMVPLVWLPQLGITWTCVLLLCFKVPLLIKKGTKN